MAGSPDRWPAGYGQAPWIQGSQTCLLIRALLVRTMQCPVAAILTNHNTDMEDFDARLVIRKFLRKWPVFALCLGLSMGLAYLYTHSVEKQYLVQASIQLKDQNLSEKGTQEKKFINGMELLENNAVLDDEIGILTSFSTLKETVEKSDMYTSIYKSNSLLDFKPLDKLFSEELFQREISIRLIQSKAQLVEEPVYIRFLDKQTFLVEVETKEAELYNFQSNKVAGNRKRILVSQKGKVNQPFLSPFVNFILVVDTASHYWKGRYHIVNHSLKELTESYQKRLVVTPITENANIVNLEVKGPIVEKEIAFLNRLSNTYVVNDLKKRNQLGVNTISFIDTQINQVSDSLYKAENKLEQFRSESNVIDIGMSAQTLAELSNQLEEKQIERKSQIAYYQYLSEYLSKNASLDAIVGPSTAKIEDPTLTALLGDLNSLLKERLTAAYTGNNPKLKNLDQKIANTKKTIADDIKNLIQSIQISIQQNQYHLNTVKQKISQIPVNERSLNTIQRKFQLNDDIYKYLLQKRAEASIAIASSAPDKSIIDPAHQIGSKQVSPNVVLSYLIAIVLGLVLPAGFISFNDYFNQPIEGEEQVEKETSLPVVASVMYDAKSNKYRPFTNHPYNDSAFQGIRQYVRFKNQQVIGITSMASNEGKTFCAINLATAFARTGHKTLLIDTDFYQSDVGPVFNLDSLPGLIDFLPDLSKLAIHQTSVPNLDVIGAGLASENSRSAFLRSSIEKLLKNLRNEYAYIIIDTCPVGLLSDYFLFSSCIDHTFVVVRSDVSRWKNVSKLNALLNRHNLLEKSAIIYNGIKVSNEQRNYYKKIAG
jgi:capsular exopolysaccharide synthesis family protein